ncbi:MAG: hypothetical protein A2Y40_02920 [Candidatus Margulisbacteria bacterium GWF2_35_9]|nr:MAG: hypothetical protein A2Y40_02920 [Candidatus Margulisbacteria bacterium GWF2_35_9]
MKNIFITGGSSGIGLRLTVDYLKENQQVFSSYYSNSKALDYLKKKNHNLHPTYLNLSDIDSTEIPNIQIDTIILTAGVIHNQLLIKENMQDFQKIIEQNLTANFQLCQKLIPLMKSSNNPHIVFISSHSGYIGNTGQISYSASKAGLIGLANSIAKEHAKDNIKVNTILPGFMKSKQTLAFSKDLQNKYADKNMLKRFNTLCEVSKFIQHICESQNISGQIFKLDSRI